MCYVFINTHACMHIFKKSIVYILKYVQYKLYEYKYIHVYILQIYVCVFIRGGHRLIFLI